MNIPDATGDTYTTPALALADNGAHYSCVLSAGQASVTSREALVGVVDNSGSYPSAVLADAPLVYYRFDEPVGEPIAYDASGQGKSGTYANVTLGNPSASELLGQAGSFNNVNSSVAVPVLGDQLAQVTLEAWVKPNSMVTFDTIYDEDGWNNGWIHCHLGNGSRAEFSLAGNTPTDYWMAGPANFQVGQWTHAAFVYDSTAATLTLYVNGQPVVTNTYSVVLPATLQTAHIGAWNGNDRAFDGLIDEFAIYGTALAGDRIAVHYAAATPVRLAYVKAGNQLTLSWTGAGYKLQQNADLANRTGWTDVPAGDSSPAAITVGAGNRFFRLVKP